MKNAIWLLVLFAQDSKKILADLKPLQHESTAVGAFVPAMKAAGLPFSAERLAGTFGHSFCFSVKKNGKGVYQTSTLEWGPFLSLLDHFPHQVKRFDAALKGPKPVPEERFQALQKEAWVEVKKSIDRGVPAIAWGAMTPDQKKEGLGAYEWSLIVGYEGSSYIVRHRNVDKEIRIPFDGIGHSDPIHWLCIIVIGGPKKPIPLALEVESLKFAVAIAKGERGKADDSDASGFDAFETWIKLLRDGQGAGGDYTGYLQRARTASAKYLREIAPDFVESTRKTLLEAADHYDRVAASAEKANQAIKSGRTEDAIAAVTEALESERQAVSKIEASLK